MLHKTRLLEFVLKPRGPGIFFLERFCSIDFFFFFNMIQVHSDFLFLKSFLLILNLIVCHFPLNCLTCHKVVYKIPLLSFWFL